MHRGVYPLSLARHLLGPVTDLSAMAQIGETGVDEDCALSLRHRSGSISTLRASLRTVGASDFTIHGTTGVIHIEAPVYRPFAGRLIKFGAGTGKQEGGRLESVREGSLAQGLQQRARPLIRLVRGQGGQRFTCHYRGNGYHYEAEALMQAVSTGALESDVMPLDESLEIMTTIDRVRAAWQSGASV